MNIEEQTIEAPVENEPLPWGVTEVIYGIIAMMAISGLFMLVVQFLEIKSNIILIGYELVYLLPPIVVIWLKKAPLRTLGLRRFAFTDLLFGFAILFLAYIVIFVHNLALMAFNIAPQGEYIAELFDLDINLWVLGVAVVIVAPIAEEIFFRSFLYAGLEESFGGNKAILISALLFGAAHMQLVAFIPTFLMGLVLAYVYRRSRSVLPGIILHFAVNGLGFTMIYLLINFSDQLSL